MGTGSISNPLVSVICLCYNHERFVEDAVLSVLNQDYQNIELIIADDCSSDNSVSVIKKLLAQNPEIKFIPNEENIGNCRTFNNAFKISSGEFIIDLAADDVLEPTRVNVGVEKLKSMGSDFGIHYSDAWITDVHLEKLYKHSASSKSIQRIKIMPEGLIFKEILSQFFICPPTLMARREVFETLNGYDESLSYEDFDFLVRSSRIFKFCYSNDPLVLRRIVDGSKSSELYNKDSRYHQSTLEICSKASDMVKTMDEKRALNKRLFFECRQVIWLKKKDIAKNYILLMKKNGVATPILWLYSLAIALFPSNSD
jgi:glycosyltransferase involved in cell wall biosynthesis